MMYLYILNIKMIICKHIIGEIGTKGIKRNKNLIQEIMIGLIFKKMLNNQEKDCILFFKSLLVLRETKFN